VNQEEASPATTEDRKVTSDDRRVDRSAGVPPAVSGASRPRFGDVTIRDRGRLPHWEKDSATYFITFRLADSLPQSVLRQIEFEKQNMVRTANRQERELSPDEYRQLARLSSVRIERYLDSGAGACYLRNPSVAEVVSEALLYFDERRYRLFSWCVMPNHVHVVVGLFPGNSLAVTLHSWKSFTAKKTRALTGTANLWQREYYDHLLRSEAEFERAIQYVLDNPTKAGLRDWQWVWMRGRDALATAGETPALRL
jgi:REP element-mobilizing transposase RayT